MPRRSARLQAKQDSSRSNVVIPPTELQPEHAEHPQNDQKFCNNSNKQDRVVQPNLDNGQAGTSQEQVPPRGVNSSVGQAPPAGQNLEDQNQVENLDELQLYQDCNELTRQPENSIHNNLNLNEEPMGRDLEDEEQRRDAQHRKLPSSPPRRRAKRKLKSPEQGVPLRRNPIRKVRQQQLHPNIPRKSPKKHRPEHHETSGQSGQSLPQKPQISDVIREQENNRRPYQEMDVPEDLIGVEYDELFGLEFDMNDVPQDILYLDPGTPSKSLDHDHPASSETEPLHPSPSQQGLSPSPQLDLPQEILWVGAGADAAADVSFKTIDLDHPLSPQSEYLFDRSTTYEMLDLDEQGEPCQPGPSQNWHQKEIRQSVTTQDFEKQSDLKKNYPNLLATLATRPAPPDPRFRPSPTRDASLSHLRGHEYFEEYYKQLAERIAKESTPVTVQRPSASRNSNFTGHPRPETLVADSDLFPSDELQRRLQDYIERLELYRAPHPAPVHGKRKPLKWVFDLERLMDIAIRNRKIKSSPSEERFIKFWRARLAIILQDTLLDPATRGALAQYIKQLLANAHERHLRLDILYVDRSVRKNRNKDKDVIEYLNMVFLPQSEVTEQATYKRGRAPTRLSQDREIHDHRSTMNEYIDDASSENIVLDDIELDTFEPSESSARSSAEREHQHWNVALQDLESENDKVELDTSLGDDEQYPEEKLNEYLQEYIERQRTYHAINASRKGRCEFLFKMEQLIHVFNRHRLARQQPGSVEGFKKFWRAIFHQLLANPTLGPTKRAILARFVKFLYANPDDALFWDYIYLNREIHRNTGRDLDEELFEYFRMLFGFPPSSSTAVATDGSSKLAKKKRRKRNERAEDTDSEDEYEPLEKRVRRGELNEESVGEPRTLRANAPSPGHFHGMDMDEAPSSISSEDIPQNLSNRPTRQARRQSPSNMELSPDSAQYDYPNTRGPTTSTGTRRREENRYSNYRRYFENSDSEYVPPGRLSTSSSTRRKPIRSSSIRSTRQLPVPPHRLLSSSTECSSSGKFPKAVNVGNTQVQDFGPTTSSATRLPEDQQYAHYRRYFEDPNTEYVPAAQPSTSSGTSSHTARPIQSTRQLPVPPHRLISSVTEYFKKELDRPGDISLAGIHSSTRTAPIGRDDQPQSYNSQYGFEMDGSSVAGPSTSSGTGRHTSRKTSRPIQSTQKRRVPKAFRLLSSSTENSQGQDVLQVHDPSDIALADIEVVSESGEDEMLPEMDIDTPMDEMEHLPNDLLRKCIKDYNQRQTAVRFDYTPATNKREYRRWFVPMEHEINRFVQLKKPRNEKKFENSTDEQCKSFWKAQFDEILKNTKLKNNQKKILARFAQQLYGSQGEVFRWDYVYLSRGTRNRNKFEELLNYFAMVFNFDWQPFFK